LTLVFDFDGQAWFDASQSGQDVIQNLFGGHPKRSATRRNFQPTGFVAVIAFGK
jgi:hypothetical protein